MKVMTIVLVALLLTAVSVAQRPQIPDAPVFDQEGRRLSFYSDLVRGHVVAIDFVFTTCTTICPVLSANFKKVQQELGPNGHDVRLISISVDPAIDTPERLKRFGKQFDAGPGWTFITGDKADIDRLLNALGANSTNKLEHTPVMWIGNDKSGHWQRVNGLSSASVILHAIHDAASH